MDDNETAPSDSLLRELLNLDESLSEGADADQFVPLPKDLTEADSELLTSARESLKLIETVRRDSPQLFAEETTAGTEETAARIGRFEIVRELGRGGCGVVLLARDPNLNRDFALKLPLPDVLLTPALRDRFLREGKAAAALRHPHIVPIYEAADLGGICYLISEFCEGPTLAEWFADRGCKLEPKTAAAIVRDLAAAVHHAHERGVVHCDLKPGNVLLDITTGKPFAKITDFGMARLAEAEGDLTRTGSVLGTPAYMAPEQAAGDRKSVGPATDVFALGVILYELLTGRRPFQKDTVLATLHAIQNETQTTTPTAHDGIPKVLEEVLRRCLTKNPSKRYAKADDLATDLQKFLNGESIPSQTVKSRRRVLAWLGGVGIVGVVGALYPVFFPGNQGSGEPDDAVIQESERAAALNRRVAEKVLQAGGQVSVTSGDQDIRVLNLSELPPGPFEIYHLVIGNIRPLTESLFQDLLALSHCKSFHFLQTDLTDEHLQRLSQRSIVSLQLYSTKVSEDGLRHLHAMPELTDLVLRSTNYTNKSLDRLAGLPQLTSLKLHGLTITEDGLRHLKPLTKLRELYLGHVDIGDTGLQYLWELTSLKQIHLTETNVTEAGERELRRKLPRCEITVR